MRPGFTSFIHVGIVEGVSSAYLTGSTLVIFLLYSHIIVPHSSSTYHPGGGGGGFGNEMG